ncbi:hypothetical protein FHS99_000373 [Sphingomonas prati]|uniref:Uncharacterized protein n=2 Tax=Sphingomonas prati TaxID=1843237 RepID=A0A7W9BPX2_9SPHN|nr:hypothetical protein [Sphingomonas prati]MBB5727917.1 hypothetical protein [Sphingomonas prati]
MNRVDIPKDVWTFWTRGGVLQPVEGGRGTGNRNKFPWYEANIAAIMNQLRILGVKIEGMLSIARVYRDSIAYFEGLGVDRDQVNALWQLFIIQGHIVAKRTEWHRVRDFVNAPDLNPERFLHLVEAAADYSIEDVWAEEIEAAPDEKHGAQRVTLELWDLWSTLTREEFYRHLDPYLTVTEQPKPGEPGVENSNLEEMTYFWRVGEGDEYRFSWGSSTKAGEDGATAMIAVDVTAVLYKVWNSDTDEAAGHDEGEGE